MKLYVYSLETGRVVAIITGADNQECETLMAAGWDANDYEATYSPGMVSPEVGEEIGVPTAY